MILATSRGVRPSSVAPLLRLSCPVHLRRFEILMPENYFRDDFEWRPVPARIGRRVPHEVVRSNLHAHFVSGPFEQRSGGRIADRKKPVIGKDVLSVKICS